MKHVKKLLSSALAITLTLTCAFPVGVSAAKSFSDVRGHWAAEYIMSGVNRGYINGYENGTFHPNGSVTRAEFCKMINNAMGLTNTTTIAFLDVASRDWFYTDVAKAVASGYIAGYDDGTFRANDNISRQEAAVVISRIVSEAGSQKDIGALRDAGGIASWALAGANTVFSKGYMGGDNQKKFNPNGYLTRGEAVKIVEAILNGEKINRNATYVSNTNETASNQVYSGNVTVSANGNSTFKNCRILGTLSVTGESTVRLEDCKVGKLAVNASSGKAEVIASGNTDVRHTDLATGATLTENGVYSAGFQKVNLSGSKLSSQQVALTGMFTEVNLTSESNLSLRSGWIQSFRLASSASGSKISLLSGTRIEWAELNGRGDFTGYGTIQYAVLNNTGSTFETQPLRTDGKSSLVPNITPKNGASDVSVTGDIRISFGEAIYTSSNSSVTSSYVEDKVVELRRDSSSGSLISYRASITSNKREITIDPSSTLSSGTRYYVIVKSALRNSRGEVNDRMIYSFTTQGGLTPTVYPADGSTNIPVSNSISLEFGESVYRSNGDSLSSSYLEDTALELRYGSKNGRLVSISPSISSNRRTITISVDGTLSTGTTYYLVLRGGTIANSSRETLSEQVYSFTTASSNTLVPSMTPSPGARNVSTGTDIVLNFDTTIYTSSGNSMTSSYLEDSVFSLRRDSASGSSTRFRASLNYSNTRVTLTPDSELRDNTTYYLVMSDNSLTNGSSSNRRYNDRLVLSFSTGSGDTSGDLAPDVYPSNGSSNVSKDTNITLNFDTAIYRSDSYRSEVSESYLENHVLELRADSSSGSHVDFDAEINSSNRIVTIRPKRSLSNNTRYYVIVREDSIQNYYGLENSRFVSYFSCGRTGGGGILSPSISPSEGSNGASPTTDITLSFDEDIYDFNGDLLSNDTTSCTYITKYAVTLRSGSETGDIVLFNTNHISNNQRITLTPTKSLNTGTTYYVVLEEGKLQNSSGQSNKRQVFRFTVGSGLTVTTSPEQGDSRVSRNDSIVLDFNDPIYDNNNNWISESYLKSCLSISPGISYSAYLSNGNRRITINPYDALEANRTYTVTLPANSVMNSSGDRNSTISFSFTTDSTALQASVRPSYGSNYVSPDTNITLSFGETLYHPSNGSILSNWDAENAIELRRDGTWGTITSFTASVSGRTITLTPKNPLERGKTYYVIVKSGGMANSSRMQNAYQYSYFTVQPETYLAAPSLNIGSVKSDGTQEVTVNFSTAVKKADGGELASDSGYITSNLKLKNGSTEISPASATISSDNRTITLTYPSPLAPSTTYTLSAPANVFSDSSGSKNSSISVSKSTPAPVVSVSYKDVEETTATIQLNYDYPGSFTVSVTPTDGGTAPTGIPTESFSPVDSKIGPFQLPIKGMSAGKTYAVNVEYIPAGGSTPIKKTTSFTTLATPIPSDEATLSKLSITDTIERIIAISSNMSTNVLPKGDQVIITPTASNSNATITVNDAVVESGASTSITVDQPTVTVRINVVENGSHREYILTLTRI